MQCTTAPCQQHDDPHRRQIAHIPTYQHIHTYIHTYIHTLKASDIHIYILCRLGIQGTTALVSSMMPHIDVKYDLFDRTVDALIHYPKALVALTLSRNAMQDEGATHIGNLLQHNSTLARLDLSYNMIGDQGVAHIARALTSNNALEKLVLGYNTVGDEGVTALADCVAVNTHLCHLHLQGNKFGHRGTCALVWVCMYVCMHLQSVSL
jgi:hypothetical protein